MQNNKKTASYKVVPCTDGNKYEFFCDLSGALVSTGKPVKANTTEEELLLAWENGARENFNRCRNCGNWVLSVMYNPDVLCCVKCVPLEEYPDYCPECGAATNDTGYFCHMCGTRLLYGGEMNNEKTECN